jgi:rod shape-determining protein MreD
VIADRLLVLRRAAPVLLGVLMVQVGVMTDLPLFGAIGDLMLLVTLATASVAGPDRGATYGFAVGVLYDLLLDTPFGMSALVYAVVGYAVGVFASWALQPRWWFHVLTAVGGSWVAVVVMVVVARVLGLPYPLDDVVRIALVVSFWNGLLILPARRMMRWVVRDAEDDSIERYRMVMS